jgi:formamidopyrimidine-DNA glycosylase
MPEGIEVEMYRRASLALVGREIAEVRSPDPWFLKGGTTGGELAAVLVGQRVDGARRVGKLALLDVSCGATLGLRFGMTGRVVVDGAAPIVALEYAPTRDDPQWDRFTLVMADGGALRMQDPRRLGGVVLDPDETELGPDIYSLTLAQLRGALAGSEVAVKARLLDQRRIAGLGNLLVDEILWRSALDPRRPAGAIDDTELRRLHRTIRSTVALLTRRGGSHTGDLFAERHRNGLCPRDGSPLQRFTIGGRTTYACATHQTS